MAFRRSHRCLDIPEILDAICANLIYFSDRGYLSCQYLPSVARTSKGLHAATIRHIWAEIPCLEAIVGVFPERTFRVEKNYYYLESATRLYLPREGLERLSQYARHVRSVQSLNGYDPTAVRFHYSTLQALCRHPACPQPLFPKLKSLVLPCHSEYRLESVFYSGLVCSNSIRTLTVRTKDVIYWDELLLDASDEPFEDPDPTPHWDALGGRIADIGPRLTAFGVEYEPMPVLGGITATGAVEEGDRLIGRLPTLLRSFSHFSSSLESLDVPSLALDGDTLTSLGHLTGLKTLRICLLKSHNTSNPFGLLDRAKGGLCLPSLQTLFIHSADTKPVVAFLRVLSAPSLSQLQAEFELGGPLDLENLFAALLREGYQHHLTEIIISKWYPELVFSPWNRAVAGPRFSVQNSTLKALKRFSKMAALSISPCTDVDIGDEELDQLFASWPSLKAFKLDDEMLTPAPPARLTLQGLHDALQHVPHLQTLSIRFDGLAIPSSDARPHPSLSLWNVLSSSLVSGNKFVDWVEPNYPSLARFKAFSHYVTGVQFIHLDEHMSVDDEDREEIDSCTESAVMLDRWNDVCVYVQNKGLVPRAEYFAQIWQPL
ncbi:hypothetical protein BKA70DRAFT_1297116 [Coprinopsis sp. MPI-PUGE-AT-0042]|nr:hypothetical protein BKA70DRAFT_1297116 [Coprinopsis sp. MPI-PUGE-AT-0042]